MRGIKQLLRCVIALNIAVTVIALGSLAFGVHTWLKSSQSAAVQLLNEAQVNLRLARVHHCLYVRGDSNRILTAMERANVRAEVVHLTEGADDLIDVALARRNLLDHLFNQGGVSEHAAALKARATATLSLYVNGYDDAGGVSPDLRSVCGWSRDQQAF